MEVRSNSGPGRALPCLTPKEVPAGTAPNPPHLTHFPGRHPQSNSTLPRCWNPAPASSDHLQLFHVIQAPSSPRGAGNSPNPPPSHLFPAHSLLQSSSRPPFKNNHSAPTPHTQLPNHSILKEDSVKMSSLPLSNKHSMFTGLCLLTLSCNKLFLLIPPKAHCRKHRTLPDPDQESVPEERSQQLTQQPRTHWGDTELRHFEPGLHLQVGHLKSLRTF